MSLQYNVVVSPMERLPEAGRQPPVGPPAAWSPLSSTLIYGPTELVLTDPPITTGRAVPRRSPRRWSSSAST